MAEYTKPARIALIAYGSETGNAYDYAEELGRLLQRIYFETRVVKLDEVDIVRMSSTDRLSSNIKCRTERLEQRCYRHYRCVDYRTG